MTWHVQTSAPDRLIARLVHAQRRPRIGRVVGSLLRLRGTDIDPSAQFGEGLRLRHAGIGVVVHARVRTGRNVTVYHNVTIGRADVWRPLPGKENGRISIGDEAVIGAGAAVLVRSDQNLHIGEGTIVGANAVLTGSTGEWEIWAGSPARKIGDRPATGS